MVNEFRLNYTRLFINQTEPAPGVGVGKLSSFGFKTDGLGLIGSVPDLEGLPTLNVSGSYGFSRGRPPIRSSRSTTITRRQRRSLRLSERTA